VLLEARSKSMMFVEPPNLMPMNGLMNQSADAVAG
jgi:hypothetical protein